MTVNHSDNHKFLFSLVTQGSSVLMELMHQLIGMATGKHSAATMQEAARCLGEIGPVNLYAIAIKASVQLAVV